MNAHNLINTLTASDLRNRIKYYPTPQEFIKGCLQNTRHLATETLNKSELLFFAMTTLGRHTKGTTAQQDFVALFDELGLPECKQQVQDCVYTKEDMDFYWSDGNVKENWFLTSDLPPRETFATHPEERTIARNVMANRWTDQAYHELDKIPHIMRPLQWEKYHVDNATLIYDTAEFAVLDSNGKPIPALCSKNFWHVFFTDNFHQFIVDGDCHSDKLNDALMIQDLIRAPNFCHWMLDQFPRTRHLTDSQQLIMYKLANFMRNTLESCGISGDRVHEMGERTVLQIDHLDIESSMAKDFHHPCQHLNADLIEYVKNSLCPTKDVTRESPGREFIYLSRNKTDRRRISNEPEMLELLGKFNFHVIYPEELSPHEQAELFNRASVIVSPHGAALTNIIFCDDVTLIEIFNQNYGTATFYLMAHLLGFSYQHILGTNRMLSDQEKNQVGMAQLQCEDIEVDLQKLEEILSVVMTTSTT